MLSFRHFQRADFVLLGATLALVAIGCLMIYSCTRVGADGSAQLDTLRAQLIWVVLGFVVLVAAMSVDYMRLSGVHLVLHGAMLLLLLVALLMPPVRGTHRWIILGPLRMQPAELAQIAVVLTVACVAAAQEQLHDFLSIGKSFLWLLPAMGLILKQPDLGTPIVILSTWFGILLVAGARWSHLAGFAAALLLLFSAAWFSGAIEDYQKDRLLIFLHPEKDPMGGGYHVRQSLTAVGNGGFLGRGLFRGPQTQGNFVPDQHTDFIFTAVAEELGFVGSAVVLGLFGVVLWRCMAAIAEAKDVVGRLIATGVTVVLGLHVIANIAMTVGLAPVKGMPLPLMSYGGSSMLATMLAIGLVESVYMRRHKIAF